jgi:secreted trypsin-like serine protease
VVLTNDNEKKMCGGFLVTYQHFITAAHCVQDKSKELMAVYAGLQRLSSRWFIQKRAVAAYTYHPSHTFGSSIGDVAVVKLSSSFDMDEKIGLCCLNWNLSLPAMNEHGAIVGWGVTAVTNISASHISEVNVAQQLHQAIVQVEDPAMCNITATADRRFCAGYGRTDACYGDSGSPFMTSENNSWTCSGIVSTGDGCGNGGVYTRVSFYRDFIEHALLTL